MDEDKKQDGKVISLEEFRERLCEDCEENFEEFVYGYLDQLSDVIGAVQKNQAAQFKLIINLQRNLMNLVEGRKLETVSIDEEELEDDKRRV